MKEVRKEHIQKSIYSKDLESINNDNTIKENISNTNNQINKDFKEIVDNENIDLEKDSNSIFGQDSYNIDSENKLINEKEVEKNKETSFNQNNFKKGRFLINKASLTKIKKAFDTDYQSIKNRQKHKQMEYEMEYE
ncbi:MAG: hypothetical protein RR290_02195 [Clostridia bacterium]